LIANPQLFWTIFSAVLLALILAGTFFWGLVAYTRLERAERQWSRQGDTPLIAIIMPLGFLALAMAASLG
jgi:hypothetical protein